MTKTSNQAAAGAISARQYLDLTQTLMVALDAEGRIAMLNRAGCELLGYAEDDILGRNWFATCLPQPAGREIVLPVFRRIMSGDLAAIESFENEVVCRDGTRRLIRWNNAEIRDETGRIIGALSSGEDITERKRIEKASQLNEERFKAIMDHSPILVDAFDSDGRCILWNRACEMLFGWNIDEINAAPDPLSLFYPDPEIREQVMISVTRSPSLAFHEWHPHTKIGGALTCMWANFQLPDGVVMNIGYDLTERKRAMEALREREDVINAIFDATTEALCLIDIEGTLLMINSTFANRFNKTSEDLIGISIYDLIAPEVAKTRRAQVNSLLKSSKAVRFEDQRGDRFIEHSLYPIFDGVGNVNRIAIYARDITDRKQAEQALRLSEEKYRIVADNTYDWEFWLNPEGRFNYVSPSCMRITGYDMQDFMSDPELIFRIVHPEDRPVFEQHHLEADKQMKPGEVEFRIIRKDGELRWIGHICMPVYGLNGQFLGTRGSNRDITARKKAEMAMQESGELFLKAFRNAPLLMTMSSVEDGVYIDVNEKFIEVSGFSRDEAIGKTSIELGWISAEDRKRIIDALAPSGHAENMEFDLFTKYNKKIRCLYSGQYVTVHGIRRILSIASNITELKRIEEKRLVMSKLESTGILAGGIAHDFNNLLAVMVGNLEMARSLAVQHGEIDEHLAAAEKAACDARSLTQQLITLTKGGSPLLKPISLSGLLKEQVALTLRGSSVNLEISVPSDLWRVEVDEGQVRQVIRNLVLNAREAMPAGGMVRVTAENQVFNGETDISLPDGNYVTVSITDQGGGIAEEILENIFDPYFSTKQRGVEKGMGLGLTICQSIILKHGGMIRVSSKAGVGATFFIYLPASDKPVQEEKRKAPSVQSGGGRILLMDDEEGLRNLYAAALKKSGYDVSLAGNGEAAIDLYKEAMAQGRPFDAVILDLTVRGGIGGLDAMKSLLAVDPDVRAVISSGYSDDPAMMDHERHGFKGVLAKPFGIAELREVLSRVRKQREMTHE